VLRALAARAPAAPPAQLEYLLQKVLMLLATMARRAGGGRSPPQLRAAAATAYHALRAVAACEARRAARAPGPLPSAPRPAARALCAAVSGAADPVAARVAHSPAGPVRCRRLRASGRPSLLTQHGRPAARHAASEWISLPIHHSMQGEPVRAPRGAQAGEQSVGLHLVAALQALRREAELLEPHQRNHLAGLLRDAAAATPAITTPAALPANPNRATARPAPAAPAGGAPGGGPPGGGDGAGGPAEPDGGDQGFEEQGASIFAPQRVQGAWGAGLGGAEQHTPQLRAARGSREGGV